MSDDPTLDLTDYGITQPQVLRNPAPARLYELAIEAEQDAWLVANGALAVFSGEKTGRSPGDKRIVEHDESKDEIDWGEINIPFTDAAFAKNRQRAADYLNALDRVFAIDAFAGADPAHRLKVRVLCDRCYHALFMWNMLVRPTAEELASFGEPDLVIYNAGLFPADPHIRGVGKFTSINVDFEGGEMVILGSQYAGEMKKGVFTVMNYLMPKRGHLSMHCSATEGMEARDVSLFFGLSGTGKTTLSADPKRRLIGDDEHVWTEDGVFNIEGGCYAKTIGISPEQEPDIYRAIRFGAVLENVVFDKRTREVDYSDDSITSNTRASYPIHHIDRINPDGVAGHPTNVIFLTCDAFGVMPPVARLTPEQAMYHFISGYTAKIPGTEVGITEPRAAFSACFGAPFMVWPPSRYAQLLAGLIERHDARVWLVNTGWTEGPYGEGHRIDLPHTRAIVDAIHDGSLEEADCRTDPTFGFTVPTRCPDVPDEVLQPRDTWDDGDAYDAKARALAQMFQENFEQVGRDADERIRQAGPKVEAASE